MTAFGGIDSTAMSGNRLYLPEFIRWRLRDAGNCPVLLEQAAQERDGLLGSAVSRTVPRYLIA